MTRAHAGAAPARDAHDPITGRGRRVTQGASSIVLAGQGRWSRVLTQGLWKYANLNVSVVPFDHWSHALDMRRWRELRRARTVVLIGFRPGAATLRGRAFDALLDLATARRKIDRVYYWIGSDVARATTDFAAGRDVRRFRRLAARARHLAGSPPLLRDLADIGIDAELAPFPWEGVPRLSHLAEMPRQLTVLSYVPDSSPQFYGGPLLLAAARALPEARFVIMGGTGTWAPDAPANVEFAGWVADPSPLYADASVVVRLAAYDSIGGTAVEGLVHGRPVIYSGELEHSTHVDFGDVDQLVAELRALSDRHTRGELTPDSEAASWASAEFDPEARFTRLARIIEGDAAREPRLPRLAYLCLQATTEGQASHAHVHEIIDGLKGLGWTVDLFEPSYAGKVAPGALQRVLEFARVQARVAGAIRGYDALYVRAHPLAAPAARAARIAGVPVVQECNGPHDDLFLAWPSVRPLATPLIAMARTQYRQADALIAVTDELAGWLSAETGRDAVVVGNGANVALFHPDALRPHGMPSRYVVFFGALAAWQGVKTLLDAATSPHWPADVALVIAGDGALRADAERAAAESGRVVYAGRVPYGELPGLVAASIASVVPKNAEAHEASGLSPLKLFESMACGVPVVVSDVGGMGERVNACRCGLVVPPGDAEALARAVAILSDDPTLARALGSAGRDEAVANHSWAARAADTAAVIRGVLTSSPEPRA